MLSVLSFGGTLGLAWRNLFSDKLRLALSVMGVALAVMLILFLRGMQAGVFEGTRAYMSNTPGSVVVMPAGVKNTFTATGKYLPAGAEDSVRSVDGVAGLTPVLRLSAIPDLHGRKEYVIVIGYDPALGGGAWSLSEGREPAADNEVVLDRVLAARHGFEVGDTLEIGARQLKVVGLSKDTSSWVGAYVFARRPLVESLVLVPGAANLLFVEPSAGTKPAELVSRLRAATGANAMLKSEVIGNDKKVLAGIFGQVLTVMVAVAFIVGALVVGMVIYTATIERQREYGVLKAIGARNGALYRTVLSQGVAAAGLGVLLGVVLAFAAGWLVMQYRPQFLVVIEASAIANTVVVGFFIALIGALLPARTVARLAPAEVFRR